MSLSTLIFRLENQGSSLIYSGLFIKARSWTVPDRAELFINLEMECLAETYASPTHIYCPKFLAMRCMVALKWSLFRRTPRYRLVLRSKIEVVNIFGLVSLPAWW